MKYLVVHIVFMLCLLCQCLAQISGTSSEIILGGEKDDDVTDTKLTFDGGFIITGSSASGTSGNVSKNAGGIDFWVTKFDNQRKREWTANFGGSDDDISYSIVQLKDRGYLAVGSTRSNDDDITGNHNKKGNSDAFIVKISEAGVLEWQKCFGGSLNDEATDIIETRDGNYLLSGRTSSNDFDFTSKGLTDAFLIKIDADGNIIWKKTYGGSADDYFQSATNTADGGYIACGSTYSKDGDVSGNHLEDFWVVKVNSAGNIEWQKCLGGDTFTCKAAKIFQTTGNDYVVAGSIKGGSLPNGDIKTYHNDWDFWIVKLDNEGELIWQNTFGGTKKDFFYDALPMLDGSFILAGSTASRDGDVDSGSPDYNFEEVWLLEIDDSGAKKWSSAGGIGQSTDQAHSLLKFSECEIMVAAVTENPVRLKSGGFDVWLSVFSLNPRPGQVSITTDKGTLPIICAGTAITFTAKFENASMPTFQWRKNGVVVGDNKAVYIDSDFSDGDEVKVLMTTISRCGSITIESNITVRVAKLVLKVSTPNELPTFSGEAITIFTSSDTPYKVVRWEPAALFTDQTAISQTFLPLNNVKITAYAVTEDGCVAEASLEIPVKTAPKIVNTFSPNGDGVNDTWEISGLESGDLLTVYNRYGNVVFKSRGYGIQWDGKSRGTDLPAATYYYIINIAKPLKTYSGSVTVLR